jgi:hypothetical protein
VRAHPESLSAFVVRHDDDQSMIGRQDRLNTLQAILMH